MAHRSMGSLKCSFVTVPNILQRKSVPIKFHTRIWNKNPFLALKVYFKLNLVPVQLHSELVPNEFHFSSTNTRKQIIKFNERKKNIVKMFKNSLS